MPSRPKTKRPRKKAPDKMELSAIERTEIQPVKVAEEPPQIPALYRVQVEKNSIVTPTPTQVDEPVEEEGEESTKNPKKLVGVAILSIAFVVAVCLYFFYIKQQKNNAEILVENKTKKVIVDKFTVANTESVNMVDARMSEQNKTNVPINPSTSNIEVVVSQAKLTIKDAYTLAESSVKKWSDDAKLVYIKSFGTVTPEGKSTQWQVVFFSNEKNKSYEIMVWEDKIASEKEITSKLVGNDLPVNWYDSSDAIVSLRSSPQFATGTISSINFFYNEDSKDWIYGLQTSVGGTAMHVQ